VTNPRRPTSVRQLARLIGVSEKSIRKARRVGVFSADAIGTDDTGVPFVLDVQLAVAEWERSGRMLRGSVRQPAAQTTTRTEMASSSQLSLAPAAATEPARASQPAADAGVGDQQPTPAPAPTGAGGDTLYDAQRVAMFERARKYRIDNDLREGKLLEVEKAEKQAYEFARIVRESVLNVPPRLAAALAAENDPQRVHRLLDSALRDALEATAAMLEATTVEILAS
jgi:hypothetical protein